MADGEIKYEVSVDNTGFITGMRQANESIPQVNAGLGKQSGMASNAMGAVKGLAGAYLGLKAAQAAMQLAGEGLNLAGKVETEKARLEVLLGSMQEAESVMGRVMAKAGETPLETQELQQATRMLIAFGSSSEEVIDELGMLGDVSQGVGMEVTALAEIYGKARTQGKLFAEDINQLTGRGIPIIQEFAKIMGVTEGEVKKLASEGKIGFEQLQEAMANMTSEGGQFNGMMETMSQTWEGQLSTLRDNFDQLVKLPMGEWVMGWAKPMIESLNEAAAKAKRIQEATVTQDYKENRKGKDDLMHRAGLVTNRKEKNNLYKEAEEKWKEARAKALQIAQDQRKNGGIGGNGELSDEAEHAMNAYFVAADTYRAVMEKISKIKDSQLESQKRAAEQNAAYEKRAAERAATFRTRLNREEAAAAIAADQAARKKEQDFDGAIESRDSEPIEDQLSEARTAYEELDALRKVSTDDEFLADAPAQIKAMAAEIERLEEGLERIDKLKLQDQAELDKKTEEDRKKLFKEGLDFVDAPSVDVDSMARLGLFVGGGAPSQDRPYEKKMQSLTQKMSDYLARITDNTRTQDGANWS